jgi:hypothetical protein
MARCCQQFQQECIFFQIYPTKVTQLLDGDKLGFITEEFGTIAYVNSSEEVVVRALDSLPSRPVVGDEITVTEIKRRTFSLSVTVGVGKDRVTCTLHVQLQVILIILIKINYIL